MRYVNLLKHVANWPIFFRTKFASRKPSEIAFRLRSGGALQVPLRCYIEFKDIFLSEIYTRGLARPVRGGDVIDIGANVGNFTVFAACVLDSDRVIAFEPDPRNFQQLERNVALNPGRQIFAIRKAVSATSGEAVFYNDVEAAFTTGGTLLSDRGQRRGYAHFTVQSTTLADVFAEYGVSRCALLKLDCEGAEFDILETAEPSLLERIDQIAMEVHETSGRTKKGLVERLAHCGFESRSDGAIVWAWRRG
jgi:FkbM family methyltransferase